MKRNIYLSIVLVLIIYLAKAQQDQVLGYLTRVPQSTYLNPSHSPDFKWYIGMPAISSLYVGASNNLINMHNVLQKTSRDSVKINYTQLIDNLHKKNYLDILIHEELLAFGVKVKKNYFNFSLTEKAQFYFNYPKDLLAFFFEGNGSANYLGKTADLSGIGINMLLYHELALGYSRELNSKFRVGGRAKILIGVMNLQSKKTDLTIATAQESELFDLTFKSNLLINANLPVDIDSGGFDPKAFSTFKNKGIAIDLGGTYKLNDKITLGASALDFGFIRWRYSPVTIKYKHDSATYTFSGLELNDIINSGSTNENNFSNMADSIMELFAIDTIKGKAYSTWIPTRLLVSCSFKPTKSDIFSGTAMAEFGFNNTIHPSLSLAYTRKLGRVFQTTLCYSIKNRNYANIGWGFALSTGPFQLYALTDNLLGGLLFNKITSNKWESSFMYPANSKNLNVRFGINWVFGYLGKAKDKDKGESEVQGYVQAVKKSKKESKEAKVKTDNPEKSSSKGKNIDEKKTKKETKSVIIQEDEEKKKTKTKEVKVKDDNKHD